MPIGLPPNLTKTRQSLASSGTANTATTGTQVAAPGAGNKLRLWAVYAAPGNTAQAVVNWLAFLTDGVGGATIAGATGSNFQGSGFLWIPGGYQLAANTAIGYKLQSALISMTIELISWHNAETG